MPWFVHPAHLAITLPTLLGGGNIATLRALRPASQEQNRFRAQRREIHPIAGARVDAVLTHTLTTGAHLAIQATAQVDQPNRHLRGCTSIETLEPALKRPAPVQFDLDQADQWYRLRYLQATTEDTLQIGQVRTVDQLRKAADSARYRKRQATKSPAEAGLFVSSLRLPGGGDPAWISASSGADQRFNRYAY